MREDGEREEMVKDRAGCGEESGWSWVFAAALYRVPGEVFCRNVLYFPE